MKRLLQSTATLAALILLSSTAEGQNQPMAQDRQAFFEAIQSVKEGMTQAEVKKRLGEPSYVKTKADPEGITTTRTLEIWRYGCEGSGSFPSLGQVYFDEGKKVQYIYGHRGAPILAKTIKEKELRRLFQVLDKLPRCEGHDYSPLPIIRAVNSLQPLGKEKALAVIDEYLRVASHFHCKAREGLFLVLRILFKLPKEGVMPPMVIGQPDPEEPKNSKLLPRFPIVLIKDVPLFVVNGYTLGGMAQPVEDHVKYFRKNGILRGAPLQPNLEPWKGPELIENYWNNELTHAAVKDRGKEQVLRLLKTVYRPVAKDNKVMKQSRLEERWAGLKAASSKLKIVWDAKKLNYTFKDGTQLKEKKIARYPNHIWKSSVPTVTLQRVNSNQVNVKLQWTGLQVSKSLKFYVVDKHGRYLLVFTALGKDLAEALKSSFSSTKIGSKVTYYKSFQIESKEGETIQVELTGPKPEKSPLFKP